MRLNEAEKEAPFFMRSSYEGIPRSLLQYQQMPEDDSDRLRLIQNAIVHWQIPPLRSA